MERCTFYATENTERLEDGSFDPSGAWLCLCPSCAKEDPGLLEEGDWAPEDWECDECGLAWTRRRDMEGDWGPL
jgi:hypothetical protein